MTEDFEKLSDMLLQARNRLADARHGGMVLAGDHLEETISAFSQFARMARTMELQLSETSRLERAALDCRVLVNGRGAAVLAAFRGEESNVVPFIRRPQQPVNGPA